MGRALPAVYLLLAMALAVAVLPTVLRPPPEQQQSSAALNPNAPPEEEAETIIQSLRQAASRTAGATGGEQTAPATTTTTIVKPGRGRCFGDPPRQTESAYAPPCRAAFTGDNGGGTWTNVTGEEIRIAFWHVLGMPAERGPIEDTAPPGEDAAHRTARVLQQYFNERYEMYGRRLQLWAIEDSGDAEADQRASAVRQAVETKAFVATHLAAPFCEEFTRHELVCFNGNGFQKSIYAEHDPYWWSYQMDTDTVDQLAGEYICKKLVGRNADFAGTGIKGQPRKIAVLVESNINNNFRTSGNIARVAREICGFDPFHIDFAKPEEIASALAQVRAGGYTTLVLEASLLNVIQFWGGAEANQYFPEWVMINSYGLDFNDAARLTGQPGQLAHTFGMSGWELPQAFEDTDCFRAYKSVDPTTNPDANFCRLHWIDLEHIANGIQEAGPELTPESFRDGLYAMPLRNADKERPYAIGGGYSPGDHSFVDNLAEIWWNPECSDIDGGEPGCWFYVQNGKRFRPGELDDVVRVFSDGVRGLESTG